MRGGASVSTVEWRRCLQVPCIPSLVSELVNENAVPVGVLTDFGATASVYRDSAAAFADDLQRSGVTSRMTGLAGFLSEHRREALGVRSANCHSWPEPGAYVVGYVLISHETSGGDAHHAVGEFGCFFGQVRGDQHGAALLRVSTQQREEPLRLAGGETQGGFVHDQRVRVSQQCAGDAETAVHSAREGAQSLVGEAAEADDVEHVVRTVGGNSGNCSEHAQMATCGTPWMPRDLAQQHAHLTGEVGDPLHRAATEQGDTAPRLELEHETQGACLARTLRPQKHGDTAGTSLEGEVVDGRLQLVTAGQGGEADGLDHRFSRGKRGGRIHAR